MSHELNNNPINFVENNTTVNLKQQYNTLKQKIEDLEKNNKEMLEMYKSEEQRLIKSNEFLMQKNNPNNSKNIKELEAEVLKMRNDIKQLQNLMEPRNGINLIENDNASSKSINNKIDGATEEKIREEYLINYKNKLKTEFEKKLISKHQELIDYYTEQNKKIIENNLPKENLVDIDEIKFFSIKNNLNEQSSLSDEENFDINKINLILSLFCLKEEYPKEFFIDYIFNEIELTNSNEEYKLKDSLELKRIKQDKPYHNSMAVTDSFIAQNIAKIFDINSTEDINMLSKYLNTISKKNPAELKNALNQNLTGFRYRQYETEEKFKYEEELREIFKNKKNEIKSKGNGDIIHIAEMNYFLKMNNVVMKSDLFYYMIQLMKVSKKDKLLNPKMTNSLHLYELYLPNLINIL